MVAALRRLSYLFHHPYAQVIEEVRKLTELDRGWNTYRAGRITDEAQQQAIAFLGLLPGLPGPIPPPSVAPTPNGGVALQWLAGDREVEIIFLAKGGEYSVAQRGKDDVLAAGSIGEVDLLKDIVREHVR